MVVADRKSQPRAENALAMIFEAPRADIGVRAAWRFVRETGRVAQQVTKRDYSLWTLVVDAVDVKVRQVGRYRLVEVDESVGDGGEDERCRIQLRSRLDAEPRRRGH